MVQNRRELRKPLQFSKSCLAKCGRFRSICARRCWMTWDWFPHSVHCSISRDAGHRSQCICPPRMYRRIWIRKFRQLVFEAITNAGRHANASCIDVDLGRENGNLRLQVRDNGGGFDADSAQAQAVGLGLIGIKERAHLVNARAKIVSSPSKGTTVEVSLPLTASPEGEGREIGK